MTYKPDEKDWMAYLYGELDDDQKEKFDQYLLNDPEARKELEQYRNLRNLMGAVKDKEVIAPPIVVGDNKQKFLWNTPYFRTIASIAASLLLIMLVGKLTDASVSMKNNEFRISFGKQQAEEVKMPKDELLTKEEVKQMIDESVEKNNNAIAASWKENEEKLTASISRNLDRNSQRINQLVSQAALASQEQVRQYVSTLQAQNAQNVKDYFAMTTAEQKTYIENLLVDFSEYLEQQRNNDLQLVQMRMNNIEQNTDTFKQETEQILTSLITTVNGSSTETKN